MHSQSCSALKGEGSLARTQVGALVAGPLADALFKRRLKLLLVLAMSCCCVAMAMFVLTLPPLEMKPLLPAWVRDPLIVVVGAACGLALPGTRIHPGPPPRLQVLGFGSYEYMHAS